MSPIPIKLPSEVTTILRASLHASLGSNPPIVLQVLHLHLHFYVDLVGGMETNENFTRFIKILILPMDLATNIGETQVPDS